MARGGLARHIDPASCVPNCSLLIPYAGTPLLSVGSQLTIHSREDGVPVFAAGAKKCICNLAAFTPSYKQKERGG